MRTNKNKMEKNLIASLALVKIGSVIIGVSTKEHFFIVNSIYHDEESNSSELKLIELNAIGDVKGKSLLHLQCHFGQDSISFAKMGAIVTGVDFSDVAIKEAKKISEEINVPVKFVENNVSHNVFILSIYYNMQENTN